MKWVLFLALTLKAYGNRTDAACRLAINTLVLEHSQSELAQSMAESAASAATHFQTLIQSSEKIHSELSRGDYLAATQSIIKLSEKKSMPPSKAKVLIAAMTPNAPQEHSGVMTQFGDMMARNNEAFMVAKLNGKEGSIKLDDEQLDTRSKTVLTPTTSARWENQDLFYSDLSAAHYVTPEFNRIYSLCEEDSAPGKILRERFSPSSEILFNFVYDMQKSNNMGDAFQMTMLLMHACALGDKNLSIGILLKQDLLRNKSPEMIDELWKLTKTAVANSRLQESLSALRKRP